MLSGRDVTNLPTAVIITNATDYTAGGAVLMMSPKECNNGCVVSC